MNCRIWKYLSALSNFTVWYLIIRAWAAVSVLGLVAFMNIKADPLSHDRYGKFPRSRQHPHKLRRQYSRSDYDLINAPTIDSRWSTFIRPSRWLSRRVVSCYCSQNLGWEGWRGLTFVILQSRCTSRRGQWQLRAHEVRMGNLNSRILPCSVFYQENSPKTSDISPSPSRTPLKTSLMSNSTTARARASLPSERSEHSSTT